MPGLWISRLFCLNLIITFLPGYVKAGRTRQNPAVAPAGARAPYGGTCSGHNPGATHLSSPGVSRPLWLAELPCWGELASPLATHPFEGAQPQNKRPEGSALPAAERLPPRAARALSPSLIAGCRSE